MHSGRKEWFSDFQTDSRWARSNDLWQFHYAAGNDDKNALLRIDRGFVLTMSKKTIN